MEDSDRMGACFSRHRKPREGQGLPNNHDKKDLALKHGIGRFVGENNGRGKVSGQNCAQSIQPDLNNGGSFARAYASGDEAWFDPQPLLDSESDDDYCSLNGDPLPQLGTISDQLNTTQTAVPTSRSEAHADVTRSASKRMPGEVLRQKPSADERHNVENGSSQRVIDQGSNNPGSSYHLSCLPRLLPSVSFNDKKAPVSPGDKKSPVSPGLLKARNSLLYLSFKRRSNDSNDPAKTFTSNALVENPVAGSQIPFCGGQKLIEGTWSLLEPSSFKIRGSNYLRDKVKVFASENSMYEPFGVDVFLSPKKISHLARYVALPVCSKVENLPSILILNIQIPMYPAPIFLNEADGEGLSLVLYYKLSDKHMKAPSYFKEMFLKVLNDGVEKTRGFTGDFTVPFRERLKILGRVVNPEELHMSVAEKKVVHTYNEKPVLSRPQHSFHQGDGYIEVDLDMHRFSYLARKGVESFRERLKLCILDLGLTIQGNKPDELPEHVLCCVRTNKIDFSRCKQLAVEKN